VFSSRSARYMALEGRRDLVGAGKPLSTMYDQTWSFFSFLVAPPLCLSPRRHA
jgi:hypothetical protein